MAFNDIREFELPDGTVIPVGHREFAVGRAFALKRFGIGLESESILIFMIDHNEEASLRGGVVTVVVTTSTGETGTVVIPWNGGKPVGDFQCVASSDDCIPSQILYETSSNDDGSSRCKVQLKFATNSLSGNCVTCSLTGCNISKEETALSEDSATQIYQIPTLHLKAGVDYGTESERDALPPRKGQVFIIPV